MVQNCTIPAAHACAASRKASQCAVTSKKGVIGFGSPKQSLRRKPQSPHMVCGFVVRAPSFRRLGWEGSRPAGFSQEVARSSNLSELPPSFGSECGGFSKPQPLEASHG